MILFLVAGAAVVVVVLVFNLVRAGRRREAFHRVAEDLGFTFYGKTKEAWRALAGLPLFDRGHAKRSRNVLKGTARDVELTIFDYHYTTGGGKSSKTHKQSVIAFRSPGLELPEFALRPENLFHKIGSAFGYQDIDFDGHPRFSSHYLLRGEEEGAVRALFDDAVLDYFEGHQNLCVEAAGDRLILYRRSQRIDPGEVRRFMEQGFEVYSLFARD
jgi:hypothetical protein